ncbi:MAG: hypothetical protein QOD41_2021 [Cryptosporangiaceae bacterium]|nr:hypothetical protein [Cryptosporangiaceae bacterium]
MTVVVLATCADLPGMDTDNALALPALAAAGVDARVARWDDPAEDWSGCDLVVIRSTWDYTTRVGEYLRWAESVPRLANPAKVLRWNTDKRYLRDLEAAGVPVVPTTWIEPGGAPVLPGSGEYVIKPAVSIGALDTGRYRAGADDDPARAHLGRLLGAGRTVMIQPYLGAVDTAGETSLLYLGGTFSHGARKAALLDGPDQGEREYRDQVITAREPSAAEHAVAGAALAQVGGDLLYARVDLVPGPDGEPLLLELELTEPSLFFGMDPGSPARFAEAVRRWAARG